MEQMYVTVSLFRRKLPELVLMNGLLFASNAVLNLRRERGNIALPAESEPYTAQSTLNVIVNMASNLAENQHLTYSDMGFALDGLLQILIHGHNYHEARFNIFGRGGVRIGSGTVRGGHR